MLKAELVRNQGPWRGTDDLEIAVTEYVDWFNHRRPHGEIGFFPPIVHLPSEPDPADAEMALASLH
ncbi:hypothetical protein GCM10027047_00320 [Rhodococcus aerolatus]